MVAQFSRLAVREKETTFDVLNLKQQRKDRISIRVPRTASAGFGGIPSTRYFRSNDNPTFTHRRASQPRCPRLRSIRKSASLVSECSFITMKQNGWPTLALPLEAAPPSSKIYRGSVAQSAIPIAQIAVVTGYHAFSGCPIVRPGAHSMR